MKKELIGKLLKINPLDENQTPRNLGNCQWCAIEAAKVLLEDSEPIEVPSCENAADDPLDHLMHPGYPQKEIDVDSREEFFNSLSTYLKPGELLLVSLENNDIDHVYIIYNDNHVYYLIDADRNIVTPLMSERDFIQPVKGWEEFETLDYLSSSPSEEHNSQEVHACVYFE